MSEKTDYRILNQNGTFLNAGTGLDSWFTLKIAREMVNYKKGQQIRWILKGFDMGEVL